MKKKCEKNQFGRQSTVSMNIGAIDAKDRQ